MPKVIHDFSNVPITVMEDLRDSDFTLLHDLILSGNLPSNVAVNFGRDIALMLQALAKHDEFETALSASQNYYERGLELRLAYPNKPDYFKELETRFTSANQQLIAVDTHPKNIFVNENGSTAWIDFGFSCWADRDFALPNGLAHIAIYALTGHIHSNVAVAFIEQALDAYKQILSVDEEIFCKYLATEVLHRWAGKWIDGVESAEQKLKLLNFAMKVFDQEIFTVNLLTDHLNDSVKLPGPTLGS
ncbi:MAG: hypothetical protein KBF89_08710 [Acidimicrobiia bacterium]|nr:hypothetical protein [Acidimicrobiia bacterium]